MLLPILLLVGAAQEVAADPPNVLVVVLDDVGVDLVGAYGPAPGAPSTPNLDALASEGVRFTRVWSNPNCTPSRAQLLTGRFGFRTGVGGLADGDPFGHLLQPSELTLAELLRTVGYRTAAFGKWHLGNETNGGLLAPNRAGFTHYRGVLGNLAAGPLSQADYFDWEEVADGVPAPASGYLTTAETDDALAWIGQEPGPWLCYVAYHAAHSPFHVPPPGLSSLPAGANPSNTTLGMQHDAMVEALDAELGRLVAGLGPAADDTLVIVLGDNGTAGPGLPPGLPAGQGKHTLTESGVRVPLIARGAGVTGQGASDALAQVADVFATIVDVAGVDPGALAGVQIDGVSLAPQLADPAAPGARSFQFTESFRPNGPDAGLPPGGVPIVAGPQQFCQTDLGFGGPGGATLTLCSEDGQAIVPGSLHRLEVAGAPSGAPGWLAISGQLAPLPIAGGTLAPGPGAALIKLKAGPLGHWKLPFAGETFQWDAPLELVVQAVFVDPALPQAFAFSNALAISVPPIDMKAVRDADGWKLVVVGNGGKLSLYHLPTDPFELNDLLEAAGPGGLSAEARAYFVALRQSLVGLLKSELGG